MVNAQQPELRRSERGATSELATKERLTAPSVPGVDGGAGGPIPVDNLPGHHPEHEQDKPSGNDFVAKMHALAQAEAGGDQAEEPGGRKLGPAETRQDEVLDLTDIAADTLHTGSEGPQHGAGTGSVVANTLASVAGMPFKVTGGLLGAVRNRLPGS